MCETGTNKTKREGGIKEKSTTMYFAATNNNLLMTNIIAVVVSSTFHLFAIEKKPTGTVETQFVN